MLVALPISLPEFPVISSFFIPMPSPMIPILDIPQILLH